MRNYVSLRAIIKVYAQLILRIEAAGMPSDGYTIEESSVSGSSRICKSARSAASIPAPAKVWRWLAQPQHFKGVLAMAFAARDRPYAQAADTVERERRGRASAKRARADSHHRPIECARNQHCEHALMDPLQRFTSDEEHQRLGTARAKRRVLGQRSDGCGRVVRLPFPAA
jgi:hypothetical protein